MPVIIRLPLCGLGFACALLLAAGCDVVSPPLSNGYDGPYNCSSCHGSSTNAAPPLSLSDATATTDRGVGAHQAHLVDSEIRAAIGCSECHVVPEDVDDAMHVDSLPAEIIFGPLARAFGLEPEYDIERPSCSATYCHGGTLTGGENPEPIWTQVDGSQRRCVSCHGNPPPPPHPQSANCSRCHSETVDDHGSILLDDGRHIDGQLQTEPLHCGTCHGDEQSSAPPLSVDGATATSEPGVGAHRAHGGPSSWHAEIACATCHTVPTFWTDEGHLDESPGAEVLFADSMTPIGAPAPNYDGVGCSNIACHGSGIGGGTATEPNWTQVDGTFSICGACHSLPPPPPHPPRARCFECHASMDPAGGFAFPARHIDGQHQVRGPACNTCHGDAGSNGAPPRDLGGNTETTSPGVGAHQVHLASSTWHAPIDCAECHRVPTDIDDIGHFDSEAPAELIWGSLATARGATPNYDGVGCSNLYCHGGTLQTGGGEASEPIWTLVDGSQTQCNSCHGFPPTGGHPSANGCASCHGMVVDDALNFVAPFMHIDGVVQSAGTACNACHGNDDNAAPPADLSGNTDVASIGVGAHQAHLATADWHGPIACSECHQVPSDTDDVGHLDTALPAELVWGPLASNDGATPSFDGVGCSNIYCHGGTMEFGGGGNTTPNWTLGSSQAGCGSCHGLPPGGDHPPAFNCAACHDNVISSGLNFLDASLHIDGQVDLACGSCHGDGTSPAPPFDTSGNLDTSARGVGAHQSHLGVSTWHKEVQCSACHTVPATINAAGHLDDTRPADLTWGPLATHNGATPSFDGVGCSNIYCHGGTMPDGAGAATTPQWTLVDGSQAQCDSCHGYPPAGTHPPANDCAACHRDVMDASGIFAPTLHIDGEVQISCGGCHGDGATPAPPFDLDGNTDTTFRGVGAHRSHLDTSTWHAPVACSECHLVPTSIEALGHRDSPLPADLTWGPLATANGATPSFDGVGCSNIYCHGGTMPAGGGTATSPQWTLVDGSQASCISCHGLPSASDCAACHDMHGFPPSTIHPGSTDCVACHSVHGSPLITEHPGTTGCAACHSMVVDSALNFIDPLLHIDGVAQSSEIPW